AHPAAVRPGRIATGPDQVYSGTSPSCNGPAERMYYHLYVIPDLLSRYAVGWMVATGESAAVAVAAKLIAATQGSGRGRRPRHQPWPIRTAVTLYSGQPVTVSACDEISWLTLL